MLITEITKHKLLDELILEGNIQGNLDTMDFLKRVWDIDNMPSTDRRFKTATQDIWQHYERNDDWTTEYLYTTYFNIPNSEDTVFIKFIEELVHPIVRNEKEVDAYVTIINKHIIRDGYKLEIVDRLSGYAL